MKKNIWIIAIAVILIIAYVLISKGSNKNPEDREVIKIGLVSPLSGDASSYGESILNGAILALEEVNKSSRDYVYQIIPEDGKCSGGPAASAIQKLINIDRVKYIVGGACSGETLAMAPIAEQNKILLISPFSSSSEITNAGEYIYRTAPSDATSGIFIADYIRQNHNNLAIISENTDYAQGLRDRIISRYTSIGGEISFNESFSSDTKDFRSQVLKIKGSNPEAIFVNPSTEANFIAIIQQLREQGVGAQIYGYFLTTDLVASHPAASSVVMFDVPDVSTGKKGTSFKSNFFERFNTNPSFPFAAASAYDDIHLIVNGIEKYGNSVDGVRTYFDGLKNYEGASGTFRFDENGDPVGHSYLVKVLKDGKFVVR
jgi:branched-chain amino acid transport system substrate-binding protein